jgi:ATP-binding cassette subfamily F protein 3
VLLQVSNVAKAFGIEIVLEDVSFQMKARQKVALVGRNGCGKTTLLKILNNEMEADGGRVDLARGARIAYLRQHKPVTERATVWEEAQGARADQVAMKKRLQELEARMERGASDADLEEYALLHEHFSESEGYSMESDVETVLKRLGFDKSDFDRSTDELSGGQQTRLALARLLLEEPDLLILDEPTNHLDLNATEWLEAWIRGYHGAVLLVSHDRRFLENTAEQVVELRNGRSTTYPADFKNYLKLRAADEERQAEMAAKQQEQIDKLDEYVRRFMNSQRTAQARGRKKQMERLIEDKVEAPQRETDMKAGFPPAERSGDIVVTCRKLAIGYPGHRLQSDIDWTVRWQERWGVIGDNGAGKSTLIKTLTGQLPPQEGEAKLGTRLKFGYFSQDAGQLRTDSTPLEYLMYEHGMDVGPARNLLGRFLFSGDDVFRPIRLLSGGEKNKLALAGLTQLGPNLLILDEPTNHLDMASREALADVLREYTGTLILVSHDRWLLERITTHTLDVARAGVTSFPGSYREYRQTKERPASPQSSSQTKTVEKNFPKVELSPRELSKTISKLEKELVSLEERAAKEEAKLSDIEERLASPHKDDNLTELSHDYERQKSSIQDAYEKWESAAEELDLLRQHQGSS